MNDIVENFISRSHDCKMNSATEARRSFDRYTLEASLSRNKEKSSDLRAASGYSNHVAEMSSAKRSRGKACKGKELMYSNEVERLNVRLRALEEEAIVLKQDFMVCIEERKKLIDEICQQFQVISQYLQSSKQVTGDSSNRVLIFNPQKNRRASTGLSEVLHQQYNPSFVIRDLRATEPVALHMNSQTDNYFTKIGGSVEP